MEKDKVDKAAVGFDCQSQAEKHDSQKDYSVGFGGKFEVQRDRQDKSALGWDHREELQPHASQTDYSKGFGGRYGVQKDRVDKSAAGFNEMAAATSSYEKTRPVEAGASSGPGSLRSRFENMAKLAEEESRRQAEEERVRRQAQGERASLVEVTSCLKCFPATARVFAPLLLSCESSSGGLCLVLESSTEEGDGAVGTGPEEDYKDDQEIPQREKDRTEAALPTVPARRAEQERPTSWGLQETEREDEETPPALPSRPADLDEELSTRGCWTTSKLIQGVGAFYCHPGLGGETQGHS
ncbi:hematopoietic lineage cell-specific protein-like isoform X5 [Phaenicophaeus curvirostris]|uniref:hematopoietic lineage cell-specific protein-like isoform X5 n=1 Tax=Phaenicophaeus curvirostris TaxID=33595 RepID=UPI0037F0DD85